MYSLVWIIDMNFGGETLGNGLPQVFYKGPTL